MFEESFQKLVDIAKENGGRVFITDGTTVKEPNSRAFFYLWGGNKMYSVRYDRIDGYTIAVEWKPQHSTGTGARFTFDEKVSSYEQIQRFVEMASKGALYLENWMHRSSPILWKSVEEFSTWLLKKYTFLNNWREI